MASAILIPLLHVNTNYNSQDLYLINQCFLNTLLLYRNKISQNSSLLLIPAFFPRPFPWPRLYLLIQILNHNIFIQLKVFFKHPVYRNKVSQNSSLLLTPAFLPRPFPWPRLSPPPVGWPHVRLPRWVQAVSTGS